MKRSIAEFVPAGSVGTPAGVLALRCSVAARAGSRDGSSGCAFSPLSTP
jgi:hypothetical protein